MTRGFARPISLAVLVLPCALGLTLLGSAACGQTTKVPTVAAPTTSTDSKSIQKEIDAFDPKAAAAAKNYFSQPFAKGAFLTISDSVYQQVLVIVGKQHPDLSNDQMQKVEAIVGDPLKRRLDTMVQMNILNALKTFSTDELVALDAFYASPTGQSIQRKMPKLSDQVPAIMQAIMPDYLAEVKANLKSDNVEVEF